MDYCLDQQGFQLFSMALKEVTGKNLNPKSRFGRMILRWHLRKICASLESQRSIDILEAWSRIQTEGDAPDTFTAPHKGFSPKLVMLDRHIPNHLNFMLDENSLQDMMDREEEMDAWDEGDEAYGEWLKVNEPRPDAYAVWFEAYSRHARDFRHYTLTGEVNGAPTGE
ncbi:hypothetical protein RYA05_04725 [Pseudomonas syringae pv. actinidiae]|nr:hypothetical protein [Pseudomonas syringae pv. actinidiae]